MTAQGCERIRDVLPIWALGELNPGDVAKVEEHLASCSDCAAEGSAIRRLLAERPEPPAGLEARIRARVREEMSRGTVRTPSRAGSRVIPFKQRRWAPGWVLSAAAVMLVSLGIGVIWNGEDVPEVGVEPIQVASEEPIPEAWLWDDGMVAGAPVFDDLTDAELEALIQEMER